MADTVDYSKPCERAAALSKAYYDLLAGKQVTSVSFSDRAVSYSAASIDVLEQEMRRAEAECKALTTGTPTRRAITAGTRYTTGRGW